MQSKIPSGAISFALHDAQLEIFDSPARYKVVAAGRRFGKSYLAAVTLLLKALETTNHAGNELENKEVYYIAPTFDQAKRIMWPLLKMLGKMKEEGGLIERAYEKECYVLLANGRRISVKGADDPDSLRGVGLSYVVLDEYAFMKPDVWQLIIRPALADVEGEAMFIGTPEGKNHFYELWAYAQTHAPLWQAWQFESLKNPFLKETEIKIAIESSNMTVAAARQEFGASFSSGGSGILREENWRFGPEPTDGDFFVAVDLAGFTTEGSIKKGQLKVRDEHSIAVVKVTTQQWWVKEILTGRWDTRECALRIIKTASDVQPLRFGIEKGALKNAIGPYLDDEMKRWNRYFLIHDLSAGNKNKGGKQDRIRWALEGRLEKKRLVLNEDMGAHNSWQNKLIEQANDFPSPLTHDDMLDSLAYIDQLAETVYYKGPPEIDNWEPLDYISNF